MRQSNNAKKNTKSETFTVQLVEGGVLIIDEMTIRLGFSDNTIAFALYTVTCWSDILLEIGDCLENVYELEFQTHSLFLLRHIDER